MALRSGSRFASVVAVLLGVLAAAPCLAVQPDEVLPDPALEQRARAISREVRCMVCQNQSVDDSDAPLARDLRILIRERLKAGDSNAQVQTFLLARYGEFVLLRPPLSWRTALLWGAPAGLLLGGIVVIVLAQRGRKQAAPAALAPEEEQRLRELTKV